MSFHVSVEITVWCESIHRGCTFVARLYDREREQFYSGAGDTAFEAVAWCMHDFVARALLGHGPMLSLPYDRRPGEGLAAAPSSRPRRITPAPIVTGPVLASSDSGQCFEQQIPRAAAPRLHHELVVQPEPKTTRKARGGR